MRTMTLRTRRRQSMIVQRFQLDVRGPGPKITWQSDGERAVIGTHPSANLILDDKTVSRFHAEISILDDRVEIKDLGSRNGTVVDGVPIMHAQLKPGAIIGIGRSKLTFGFAKGDVVVQLSAREQFGSLVGQSHAMRALFAILERVAPSNATVLIEGETGTGKDAAAEAIHRESPRAANAFAVVDCGAMPGALLEDELFGHEKGAFTGADRARAGLFESASGGTVFLDEIGELDIELQPKLLRVIESGEVRRIGATQSRKVDVRVVAATHRDLRSLVNTQQFRADLFYRLAVIRVTMPPLRERLGDLEMIARALVSEIDASRIAAVTDDLIATLRRHDWPGNVRELRNYLEAYLTLDAPPVLAQSANDELSLPLTKARKEFERRYLEAMLRRHGGNVSSAARAAGVDRAFFYRMLWRSGLK